MPRPLTADRVTRLLALPVWVIQNPGVSLDDTAKHFSISVPELRRDVERLWMTGTPGGFHSDLVDFDGFAYDEGRLELIEAQGLDVPVRLSVQEAQSLLLSTRIMQQAFAHDPSTVAQCQEIIELIQGLLLANPTEGNHQSQHDDPSEHDQGCDDAACSTHAIATVMTTALNQSRCVDITYVDATDQCSRRVVEPLEMLSDGSSSVWCCYCHRADDFRHLRMDRIVSATLLDESCAPQTHRAHHEHTRHSTAMLLHGEDSQMMTVTVSSQAQWLVDRLPCVSERHSDHTVTVHIEGRNERWLIRLLLALGTSVLAVEPERLSQQTRAQARDALMAYEELETLEKSMKSYYEH